MLIETATMPRLEFTLTGDHVELHNLLKLMGLADSGGSAKMRVAEGEVKVDGKIELRKTCKIRAGQTVVLDDTTIKVR
jgi:ribosome-associated protein